MGTPTLLEIPQLSFKQGYENSSLSRPLPSLKRLENNGGFSTSIKTILVGCTIADVGEDLYYSNCYGTWMGRNFKLYSHIWGGNGYTGG